MVIRDYEVPCPGEGEDQDRRCEDVGLTGFPSKVLRWKGGKEGSWQDYGCNREKGVNCNEDFPEIDFFLA